MEIKAEFITGSLMIIFMAVQVFLLYTQKKWGPRWFVPESWRRNKNAYNYMRKLTAEIISAEESGQKDEEICVICMH